MYRLTSTIVAAVTCGCVLTAAAADKTLPNGLYRLTESEDGVAVTRSSGGTIRLGQRLSENLGDVSIWSLSNTNDRFRMFMQEAGPYTSLPGHVAVYVDGVCEVIGSHTEPDQLGKFELIADIHGHENVHKIAASLNTEVRERKHPGHLMRVVWKPVKESFAVGEAVTLELEITNVGETTIRFFEGGQQRGPRDNQFNFIAFRSSGFGKSVPDTGDPTNFGGLAGFRELKPGDVFRKQVDLSKWFQFDAADSYEILGVYELELYGEDHSPQNKLWDDFATGTCTVRITE